MSTSDKKFARGHRVELLEQVTPTQLLALRLLEPCQSGDRFFDSKSQSSSPKSHRVRRSGTHFSNNALYTSSSRFILFAYEPLFLPTLASVLSGVCDWNSRHGLRVSGSNSTLAFALVWYSCSFIPSLEQFLSCLLLNEASGSLCFCKGNQELQVVPIPWQRGNQKLVSLYTYIKRKTKRTNTVTYQTATHFGFL